MKVLLDECINRKFARDLPGFDIKTVRQMGWDSIQNGALLALADGNFDALVIVDKSIDTQQNVSKFDVAVIILRAQGLKPFAQLLIDTLPVAPKGQVTWLVLP